MSSMAAFLLTTGIVFLTLSWISLLIVSFKEDYTWGLCSIFLPPLGYLYALFVWSKTKDTVLMAVAAWILLFLAVVA